MEKQSKFLSRLSSVNESSVENQHFIRNLPDGGK